MSTEDFRMKDYHDVYLKSDINSLLDILLRYRANMLREFRLDPFHSFTLPRFAFEAALKFTAVNLELISDPDQYLFLEHALRRGYATVSQRWAIAENLPFEKEYEPTRPCKYILDVDANNLYGYA